MEIVGQRAIKSVFIIGTAIFSYICLSGGITLELVGLKISIHKHFMPVLLYSTLFAAYMLVRHKSYLLALLKGIVENDLHFFRERLFPNACLTVLVPLLLLYLAVPTFRWVGDTIPARLLPVSLITEMDFDLDEFFPSQESELPYYLLEKDGHLYSYYPVFGPVVITPLYALSYLLNPQPFSEKRLQALEKLSASLYTALSALFFFLACTHLTSLGRSCLLTFIYALCTNVWSTASQLMWQHAPGLLFINLSLLLLLKAEKESKYLWWVGLTLSAAFAARPTNGIFFVVMIVFIFQRHRLRGFFALLAALPVFGFLLWYSFTHLGTPIGSYLANAGLETLTSGFDQYLKVFIISFSSALVGTLFSPSRGIFIFTPVFLLSILGFLSARKTRFLGFHPYIAWIILLHWVLVCIWPMWWGGWSYGPRLLVDVSPFLALYILPVLDRVRRESRMKRLFVIALSLSFAIQFIGVYTNAGRWNQYVDVDNNPISVFWPVDNQVFYPFLH